MKLQRLISLFCILLLIVLGCETKPSTPFHQTMAAGEEQLSIPIQEAAAAGDIGQVQIHILRGTDVNAKDKNGQTALHNAARYGHQAVVEMLIANGANVNLENKDGETPLYLAVRWGHKKLAEFLLTKGAEIS